MAPVATPRTPLLQREGELDALRAAITGARAGRGRLVLVRGGAGAGRSALLDAATGHAADQGVTAIAAAARPEDREVPYALVRRLLEPVVDAAGERERAALFAGTAAGASRLFDEGDAGDLDLVHGLHRVLVNLSAPAPLTVVVDDVQWADEPSLLAMGYLARRLAGLPVALVVGARDGEPGAQEAIVELAEDAPVTVLRPGRLDEPAVAELVQARLADAPTRPSDGACLAVTAGNPLLLDALLRAKDPGAVVADPDGAVPDPLVRWARRRLDALDRDSFEFARALAVLGDGAAVADVALLARLEDGGDAVAGRLTGVGLVHGAGRVGFEQPLVRAAVRMTIPPAERARAHARAAAQLQAAGARQRDVAAQLLRAAEVGEPWAPRVLAAEAGRAQRAGDPHRAAALLRRGLDEPLTSRMRTALLQRLAELPGDAAAIVAGGGGTVAHGAPPTPSGAASDAGSAAAGLDAADAEVAWLRRSGHAEDTAAARGRRAILALRAGRLDCAAEDAEAGLDAGFAGRPWFGPAVTALVACHLERGEPLTAAAVVDEAVRRATAHPECAPFLALARAQVDFAAGDFHAARRGLLGAGPATDGRAAVRWRLPAALAAAATGRREEAERLASDALQRAREAGDAAGAAAALRVLGTVATDPAEMVRRLDEAAETAGAAGAPVERARALHDLGLARLAGGDRTAAREALREAAALADDAGATLAARRSREALVRAGERFARPLTAWRRTPTAVETRIADLAAAGHDADAIARRCVLDRDTVAAHQQRAAGRRGAAATS